MSNTNLPPRLEINPPLLNSSGPWATTLEDLRNLYRCPATGAVTTRTTLLEDGFPHDERVHRFAFFDVNKPSEHQTRSFSIPSSTGDDTQKVQEESKQASDNNACTTSSSLNNLGYSPYPLDRYLDWIQEINQDLRKEFKKTTGKAPGWEDAYDSTKYKTFIVSVTGSPRDVAECYQYIFGLYWGARGDRLMTPIAVEVNLSCPNIPGKPPPAYEAGGLWDYIEAIDKTVRWLVGEYGGQGIHDESQRDYAIPWGLKLPPYTHAGQFDMFVRVLRDYTTDSQTRKFGTKCGVSFVTATNTLGSCLLLTPEPVSPTTYTYKPSLPGTGLGGLAGAPLHPLALGNVSTLRTLLDSDPKTKHISIIGIGGVSDAEGFKRMRSVGAMAVGVGTALGRLGTDVFLDIAKGSEDSEAL